MNSTKISFPVNDFFHLHLLVFHFSFFSLRIECWCWCFMCYIKANNIHLIWCVHRTSRKPTTIKNRIDDIHNRFDVSLCFCVNKTIANGTESKRNPKLLNHFRNGFDSLIVVVVFFFLFEKCFIIYLDGVLYFIRTRNIRMGKNIVRIVICAGPWK